VGSNLATLIENLKFLTFNIVFFEKFNKSENNIICAKPKNVLEYSSAEAKHHVQ
jgi:hypothetical protein